MWEFKNKYLSTPLIFGIGVLITYFLCDFYNDINDTNRINFSAQESDTFANYMDITLTEDIRGSMYASVMRTVPNMTVVTYRQISALPGRPAVEIGERPTFRPGPDPYFFIRRVFHEDRPRYEKRLSEQYNQTHVILDPFTKEPSIDKPVYWCVDMNVVKINVAEDLSGNPDTFKAINNLIETNSTSYGEPVIQPRGQVYMYTKMLEVVITPEGDMGIMAHISILDQIDESSAFDVPGFVRGGNNGRRISLTQVQNGEETEIYSRNPSSLSVPPVDGEDPNTEEVLVDPESIGGDHITDLIYEKIFVKTNETTFILRVFDNKTFDNFTETLFFMSIGILVSLVLAIWEYFRSSSSEKAVKASNAKSKFLSSIAHEIRTPINGIVGISDVLSKEKLDPLPKGYVDIIVSCSSSLLSLLNNVLDMSKIDAGKMENNKRYFSLRTLVLKTLRDSWGVVHAKNPKLDRILAVVTPNVPNIHIFGNDTHIFQVLNNLVSNASKFTDEGYIEVKVDAKEDNKKTGLDISIAVRDTGCGMSPEGIQKLFKPFSQVHNSNNSKDGTGLGLVISMSLTKTMGGGITCESEVGVGTTFTATFNIPGEVRKDSTVQEIVIFEDGHTVDDEYIGIPKPIRAVDVVMREGIRILVVDDNQVNQLVIKRMLESIGATNIDVAGDGKDSLNLTFSKKYDIIFMDKFMPLMNGVEATENIRKDSNNMSQKSPIIFLSADTEDETISECMNAGANEFIGKPYRLDVLINKVYKVDDSLLRTVIV